MSPRREHRFEDSFVRHAGLTDGRFDHIFPGLGKFGIFFALRVCNVSGQEQNNSDDRARNFGSMIHVQVRGSIRFEATTSVHYR